MEAAAVAAVVVAAVEAALVEAVVVEEAVQVVAVAGRAAGRATGAVAPARASAAANRRAIRAPVGTDHNINFRDTRHSQSLLQARNNTPEIEVHKSVRNEKRRGEKLNYNYYRSASLLPSYLSQTPHYLLITVNDCSQIRVTFVFVFEPYW